MSSSARGPQCGRGLPFVMHLERVCQLIDMGQTFIVEFNPNSEAASAGATMVRGVRLLIHEGGDITMESEDGSQRIDLGMTLANYRWFWRCWQNGEPQDVQCKATRWR